MKRREIAEGIVQRVDYPNVGRVRTEDGEEIAVKNCIPGQTVRFRVTKARKEKAAGTLLSTVAPSPYETRQKACGVFPECGGCLYQTVPYEQQLAWKEEQVRSLLSPYLDGAAVYDGIHASPSEFSYRNKMEFSFGNAYPGGPLQCGLHRRGTKYDVLMADTCRIVPGDYRKILACVLEFCREKDLPAYHKIRHEGYLRYLLLRNGHATGEILICLVTSTQVSCDLTELRRRLLDLPLEGRITGIVHALCDDLADNVAAESTEILYGRDWIFEELLGLRFKISLFSFFQTNSRGAEVLYRIVRDYVGSDPKNVVYDLYCGTGTIAQIVSPCAGHVYGIELVEEAVEAARVNAELNGIGNCTFLAGDVLKKLDDLPEKPDFIILDPPREGIVPKALDKIIRADVSKMVYVSCKASSLARDMQVLSGCGWRIERYALADLFPQTCHVETVCLLSNTQRPKKESYITLDVEMEDYHRIKNEGKNSTT